MAGASSARAASPGRRPEARGGQAGLAPRSRRMSACLHAAAQLHPSRAPQRPTRAGTHCARRRPRQRKRGLGSQASFRHRRPPRSSWQRLGVSSTSARTLSSTSRGTFLEAPMCPGSLPRISTSTQNSLRSSKRRPARMRSSSFTAGGARDRRRPQRPPHAPAFAAPSASMVALTSCSPCASTAAPPRGSGLGLRVPPQAVPDGGRRARVPASDHTVPTVTPQRPRRDGTGRRRAFETYPRHGRSTPARRP
jgi:hypothetical protein